MVAASSATAFLLAPGALPAVAARDLGAIAAAVPTDGAGVAAANEAACAADMSTVSVVITTDSHARETGFALRDNCTDVELTSMDRAHVTKYWHSRR